MDMSGFLFASRSQPPPSTLKRFSQPPPTPLARRIYGPRVSPAPCGILAQGFNRINRILIPAEYTFFFGSSTVKTFGVKRV
jgi:hypothetical protein